MFTAIHRTSGTSTCPRFTFQGVEFMPRLGSCIASNLDGGVYPPGVELQWRSGHYASHVVADESVARVIRAALDDLDSTGELADTSALREACHAAMAAHPNKYQADGDASGWAGESILGNAI